jgi:xenotropic and polytropic retrovirus receptor 1
MRFSNTLKSNQVNEWKDKYLAYDELKSLVSSDKERFKKRIHEELSKISDFYFVLEKKGVEEKEEIFEDVNTYLMDRKFAGDLRVQSEHSQEKMGYLRGEVASDSHVCDGRTSVQEEARSPHNKKQLAGNESDDEEAAGRSNESEDDQESLLFGRDELNSGSKKRGLERIFKFPRQLEKRKREKNIHELLHALITIKRYKELNYTGMIKLSKRYDRHHPSEKFHDAFVKKLNDSYFNKSKRIDLVHKAVKALYKRVFAEDDPKKARIVFSNLRKKNRSDPLSSFLAGLLGGASLVIGFSMDFGERRKDRDLFMAMSLIYYGCFLFGGCLLIFKRSYINYKFIFNFDVCSSMNASRYLLLVAMFALINSLGTYLNTRFMGLDPYWLVLLQLLILAAPLRILCCSSRFYLLSTFLRIILLPLSLVRFRHFYFADVAQSFMFCLKKIVLYDTCSGWKIEGLFGSCFSIIRFLQCLRRYRDTRLGFPHIANASKYIISMLAVMAIARSEKAGGDPDTLVLRRILAAFSTVFCTAWDILIDWGIVRDKMMYPRLVYGAAVLLNIGCRLAWLVSQFRCMNGFLLAFIEISRRFVWTVFRVECEHLNNCSEFRSKQSILLTSRDLFYKKDYEANVQSSETEHDSSIAEQGD